MAERGLRVCVLEAGRAWNPDAFRARMSWALPNLYHPTEAAMGEVAIPINRGKALGGGTVVNSAICFRPPDHRVQEWRRDWGFDRAETLAGHVSRIWTTLGVSINPPEVQKNNNLVFKKGADALDLKGNFMPRNAPGCVGCGACNTGCPTGLKASADRVLIPLAQQLGQVAVYTETVATGVVTKGGRVQRVEAVCGDVPITVDADHVVVCAGTIGSPRFLLANGLADSEHCGAHLHLHPAAGSVARFDWEIIPWEGVTQGYYVDFHDQGYLLETYTITPESYYLMMATRLGAEGLVPMSELRWMASAGVMLHDRVSEGRVTARRISYSLQAPDRVRMLAAHRQCARIYFAAGANQVWLPIYGVPVIEREQDIDSLVPADVHPTDMMMVSSHPQGTCRMGLEPSNSVVDPDGRVWGWDNLYVADASLFPGALGVNPQITTMGLGLQIGTGLGA
jgi:choline dehydrogenase-like flavoprotein